MLKACKIYTNFGTKLDIKLNTILFNVSYNLMPKTLKFCSAPRGPFSQIQSHYFANWPHGWSHFGGPVCREFTVMLLGARWHTCMFLTCTVVATSNAKPDTSSPLLKSSLPSSVLVTCCNCTCIFISTINALSNCCMLRQDRTYSYNYDISSHYCNTKLALLSQPALGGVGGSF